MTLRKIDTNHADHTEEATSEEPVRRVTYADRIATIDALPRRNWLIHWGEFIQSLVSLGILIYGMAAFQGPLPPSWVWLDVGLSVLFLIEFFTRSGFHWFPLQYLGTHIFDLIALVPALVFLHQGLPAEALWVWVILIARGLRVIDRVLGDGFILHNFFALLEGFEEQITDRVTLRIMARLQEDMVQGKFGHSAADAMVANKTAVLNRVREEHPHDSLTADLARFVGLEAAVERAEDRIYDAMVDILRSPEVDAIIQANLNAIFDDLRAETGKREWVKHLGIPGRHEVLTHRQRIEPDSANKQRTRK